MLIYCPTLPEANTPAVAVIVMLPVVCEAVIAAAGLLTLNVKG